jgi:hypothetical protein
MENMYKTTISAVHVTEICDFIIDPFETNKLQYSNKNMAYYMQMDTPAV